MSSSRFRMVPTIYFGTTLDSFIKEFEICSDDLVVTNKYIVGNTKFNCKVIFLEDYGQSEPTDSMVDNIIRDIGINKYSRVFAIGGGTVLDISKLLIFGANSTEEIFLNKEIIKKNSKLISIPTTVGTGSEVTSISVITFDETHAKQALVTDEIYSDSVVLIPELLQSLPYNVFAASSIDALVHASEAIVSSGANKLSNFFAQEAIRIIIEGYYKVKENGKEYYKTLLSDIGYASMLAGVAFENAGVSAVHALSYAVGTSCSLPHGLANYSVFMPVFKKYSMLGADLSYLERVFYESMNLSDTANVFDVLGDLLSYIYEPITLSKYGVSQQDIKRFTDSVIMYQQRLLSRTPVELKEEDILSIYLSML